MANYKSLYNHEHEEAIAIYCAQNNKEFDEANAYDVVLETFKNNPIKKKYKDKETDEEREYDKTQSVARQIEFQPKTIARIAAKAEVYKKRFASELYAKNIEQAKKDRVPNLDKLVENLHLLNIIDGQSYLAFVSLAFFIFLTSALNAEETTNSNTIIIPNPATFHRYFYSASNPFYFQHQLLPAATSH